MIDADDIKALRRAAEPGAGLCTIVGIEGSYSRALGSHLAIGPGGDFAGTLADGCLEAELAHQLEQCRAGGGPAIMRYGKGSPILDFRLPCGAGIDILIDPWPDRVAIRNALMRLSGREAALLRLAGPGGTELVRIYQPALKLLIFGAAAESEALAGLALAAGAEVETHGGEQGLSSASLPARPDALTAIVLLFHDHEWERAILPWALGGEAFYVGAIGGRRTADQRCAFLASAGFDASAIGRLDRPIGLIPSTRTPATLAISVFAEIVAELLARAPESFIVPSCEAVAA